MTAKDDETGTILVVDDEPHALDVICRYLALEHFPTLKAANGHECLEIVRKHSVDVILLDVMMPGLSGFDVCAALRKDEHTRPIPVILLTALDDHQTRLRGMKAGVSEFLTKPVNRHELFTRVRAQLRTRALAREIDETLAKLPTDYKD